MSNATSSATPTGQWSRTFWVPLIAGGVIMGVALGVRHVQGLFLLPITMDRGWSRETFALAMAAQNLAWGIAQPFTGMVADRFGSAKVVAAGMALYAVGLFLMASTTTSTGFLLCVGVAQSGTTFGVIYGAISRIVPPDRRGWALGLAGALGGLGQFAMVPTAQAVIGVQGWTTALVILAAATAVLLPLAFTMRDIKTSAPSAVAEISMSAAIGEAFRHRSFWLLTIGFFACGFQLTFIATHLPAYLSDQGMSASHGVAALAIIALVAVVLDAAGLDADQMQAIARWTNLSETTFVLPTESAEADYRLRIFTPDRELPFAGHSTLGSAHAVIEAGLGAPRDGRLVQECGVGLVPLSVEVEGDERRLTLLMPAAKQRALTGEEIDELIAILGKPVCLDPAPALVDVGAVWVVAELDDAETLLALQPDFARSAAFERRLGATGLSLYGRNGTGIETRSFAPSCGVNEDPVCGSGSGNGSIACFRLKAGQIAPGDSYVARQGRMTGRDGFVSLRIAPDGAVFLGGACVTTVNGSLRI